jgi:hypothetical protein
MSRARSAWESLGADERLAALAAGLLFLTMLLPWYQQNAVISAGRTQELVSRNLDAFAVFSFVEAAVLLVAAAVLALLFARAEHHDFALPGSDGAIVLLAGLWTILLLVLRLFDKPALTGHGVAGNVGIQWGIFLALAAAGLLAYAGSRMRAAERPEPPLLRRRPRFEDPPPGEELTVVAPREPHEPAPPVPAGRRPRYPPAPPGGE